MWDPSAVTSSNQLNWPNLAKKSNRIGLVPHGNSLAPDYLWPLNSRMGAWLWARSQQHVLTSGRTWRLQWVSLPLCLHFCLWGKWLHQLTALGARHSTYQKALARQGPTVQRKTDLHSNPGWLGFAPLIQMCQGPWLFSLLSKSHSLWHHGLHRSC